MQLAWLYGGVSLAFAAAYAIGFLRRAPSVTRTMIKALAVASLALVTLIEDGPLLLVAALIFCALGDAFLARETERDLRRGMAAFFAGHVAYIALFLVAGGGLGLYALALIAQLAVVVGAGLIARRLYPDLGDMRAPVLAYMAIIAVMTLCAVGLPAVLWLASLGALLFLASDAILAFELFKWSPNAPQRRWSGQAVWWLYYGGQALIVAAFLDRPEMPQVAGL